MRLKEMIQMKIWVNKSIMRLIELIQIKIKVNQSSMNLPILNWFNYDKNIKMTEYSWK